MSGDVASGAAPAGPTIELLQVPGCPLVGGVREMVRRVLAECAIPVEIEEKIGDYPSPTLLVDGRDVTGRRPYPRSACRLDLPTKEQVVAALCPSGRGRSERRTTP
ncbi:MAG: alkylmercury lyase [Candidatus Dormibacteraceae bacterium]